MTEAEHKAFMREQTLRHERATRRMERWLQVCEQKTDELIKRGTEERAERRGELRDLREESRAQRAALLLILDEMRRDGPPPRPA